jgi:hypothetical protein
LAEELGVFRLEVVEVQPGPAVLGPGARPPDGGEIVALDVQGDQPQSLVEELLIGLRKRVDVQSGLPELGAAARAPDGGEGVLGFSQDEEPKSLGEVRGVLQFEVVDT